MTPLFHRLSRLSRLLIQIGALVVIWMVAVYISSHWLPGLPPTVSGIAIALILLALGLIKRNWVADGATWLLREMLLFFIPVVIAVLQYQQMLSGKLIAIMLVIVGSTACVMIVTALAVDLAWRIDAHWHKVKDEEA
jgi:holin-like protein